MSVGLEIGFNGDDNVNMACTDVVDGACREDSDGNNKTFPFVDIVRRGLICNESNSQKALCCHEETTQGFQV